MTERVCRWTYTWLQGRPSKLQLADRSIEWELGALACVGFVLAANVDPDHVMIALVVSEQRGCRVYSERSHLSCIPPSPHYDTIGKPYREFPAISFAPTSRNDLGHHGV